MSALSRRVSARWLRYRTGGPLLDAGEAAAKSLGEKIDMRGRVEESSNTVTIPLSSGKNLILQIK